MRYPLLLACAFVCSCSSIMGNKDPHQPGAPIGVYAITADVDVAGSNCPEVVAQAPKPWTFQVTLRRDDTKGFWLSGSDPLEGTIDDKGAISFTATTPTTVHDVEKAKGLGPCVVDRTDQFTGTFVGAPSTTSGIATFSGTLTYAYAAEPGGGCADVIGQPSIDVPKPLFANLPCSVRFNVSAKKIADAAK